MLYDQHDLVPSLMLTHRGPSIDTDTDKDDQDRELEDPKHTAYR